MPILMRERDRRAGDMQRRLAERDEIIARIMSQSYRPKPEYLEKEYGIPMDSWEDNVTARESETGIREETPPDEDAGT